MSQDALAWKTMNNITHAFYKKLSLSPDVRASLAQAVASDSLEEAQHRLQNLLANHAMLPGEEPLDYIRLVRLLRKDFQGCNLHDEDFSGLSLVEFNFRGANLSEANLSNANLRQANFQKANLTGANLANTCCTHGIFSFSDLTLANCTGADFTHAICKWVKGEGVTLVEANLNSSCWSNALLRGAHLSKARGTNASFFEASLEHATVSDAIFDNAKFSHAHCSFSNWVGTNLRAALLDYSDFSHSNLTSINVEDASLCYMRCFAAEFGRSLQYNAQTVIDTDNHDLIGQVLFTCASTPQQKQLALYVRHNKEHCWRHFFELLLKQGPSNVEWAKAALHGISGLHVRVDKYTVHLSVRLSERSKPYDLQDVNASLHAFIVQHMEQHPSLEGEELYWFLCGLLAHARQQPEIELSEEQYATALARFQSVAHPF